MTAVETEWALVCTDCDWEDEMVAEGHPRDGPPRKVERRVREHKGTVDWSHVVRVEGRRTDRSTDIDPHLLTDGGRYEPDDLGTAKVAGTADPHADQIHLTAAAVRHLDLDPDERVQFEKHPEGVLVTPIDIDDDQATLEETAAPEWGDVP